MKDTAFNKLAGAVGVSAVVLALRIAFYWSSRKPLEARAPRGQSGKERASWVKKVQEEVFTTIGGTILLVFSSYIIIHRNGPHCDILDTSGCFEGFPTHHRRIDSHTRAYYNLELAWYLHQLPKHALGVGVHDNVLMHAHHLSTIVLISLAFTLGLHRSAAVILALLNISNPFLHVAKICNIFDFRMAKVLLFALFALVFLVTRVLAYPFVVLKSTCYDSTIAQPRLWFGDLAWVYFVINGLLIAVYVMQIIWMRGISRILVQAVNPKTSSEDLRRMANQHDSVVHNDLHGPELKKA